MLPGVRLQRLLAWCRIAADCREWNHDSAEQCRQLLPRIARCALDVSALPLMFRVPFIRYLDKEPSFDELFNDDDRLLLLLSDLRDYLVLRQRGYL